jgi:hypothetical protein
MLFGMLSEVPFGTPFAGRAKAASTSSLDGASILIFLSGGAIAGTWCGTSSGAPVGGTSGGGGNIVEALDRWGMATAFMFI